MRPVGKSVDWSVAVDNQQTDEDIMQISGAGHWFLDGWIGDHAVDFLVDSGSAVTAVTRSFYNNNNNMFIRTKIQGIKVHIMTFKYIKAIILYK